MSATLDKAGTRKGAAGTGKLPQPPGVICIDLETGFASADEIERRIADWQAPRNCSRAETIEAKRLEFAQTACEQSALWDVAPILCVACSTDKGLIAFDGMQSGGPPTDPQGNAVIRCGDERKLLLALRDFLDLWQTPHEQVIIVGHNVRGFDLPKLRLAYLRQRLGLPNVLRVWRDSEDERVRTADVMTMFAYQFSLENRPDVGKTPFVSFATVLRYLGIDAYPPGFEGANCPEWHEQGEYDLVVSKALLDAQEEFHVYRLMANEAAELDR